MRVGGQVKDTLRSIVVEVPERINLFDVGNLFEGMG